MDEEKPIGAPEKDGTPADPMCPPNYRMEKGGGRTIYIRCDVTPKQVETLLTHPGETLKESPKAKVRQVGHWVVKESEAGGAIGPMKHTLLKDRYRQAWLAAHHLRKNGVRVPEPLAYIEKTRLGLVTGTVYIAQFLTGFRNVEDFLLALVQQGAGADGLGGFLGHLADAVNGITAAGAYHADLAGKNIFTRDGEIFFFLDLDAVRLDAVYDDEKRMKNHVQLYDSFCDALNDTLMVPFIQRMLTPAQDLRVWMPKVRELQAERRAKIEAKWEKQGVRPRRIRDDLFNS